MAAQITVVSFLVSNLLKNKPKWDNPKIQFGFSFCSCSLLWVMHKKKKKFLRLFLVWASSFHYPRAGPSKPRVVEAWHSALLDSSSCTLTGENQLWNKAGGLPGNWKGVIKNGLFQTTSDVLLAEGNRLLGIWTALGFGLNCKVGWDFRPPGSCSLKTQLEAY